MIFRVTLGFTSLLVEAESLSDARSKARKALCEFWPNHIDMIMAKDESEIKIQCQTPPS